MRKQVIVQLDDELVAELDRVAKGRGLSRSELLRRAARAILDADRQAELERRDEEGYRRIPQDRDAALLQALSRAALETWPEW